MSDTQMLCWNCEEVVFRYALQCPYCKKSLHVPQQESPLPETSGESLMQSKVLSITEMLPLHPLPEEIEDVPVRSVGIIQLLQPVLALVLLLAGMSFFFFGIALRFFSENGVLTLQWSQDSWPYYLFSSLVGVMMGYFLLNATDSHS